MFLFQIKFKLIFFLQLNFHVTVWLCWNVMPQPRGGFWSANALALLIYCSVLWLSIPWISNSLSLVKVSCNEIDSMEILFLLDLWMPKKLLLSKNVDILKLSSYFVVVLRVVPKFNMFILLLEYHTTSVVLLCIKY